MNPILHRVLMAYRPLYLRGLLMDGQYRLPISEGVDAPQSSATSVRPRQRMLLVALADLHSTFLKRSKS
jgi:hypothetical protein